MSGLLRTYLWPALRSIRRGGWRSLTTALAIAAATVFAATAAWVHHAADAVLREDARATIGADATWYFGAESTAAALAPTLEQPGVAAWSPFLLGRSMIRSPDRSTIVFVKGIDPAEFPFFSRTRLLGPTAGLAEGEVALTRNVAERLGVEIGDLVEFYNDTSPQGLTVAHIVPTYLEQVADAAIFGVAYVPLTTASRLLGVDTGVYHGAALLLHDAADLDDLRPALTAALPLSRAYSALEIRDQMRTQLSQLLLLLHGFGAVALLIAAIAIGNTITVLVQSRVREVATMKAIGLLPRQVTAMVLTEAALLGLGGVVLGLGLAVLLSGVATVYLGRFLGLDLALRLYASPLLAGGAVGVAAAVLAGWLPARQAARIPPALAWQEGVAGLPATRWLPALVEQVQLLAVIGLLAGAYLHPLLKEVTGGGTLYHSLSYGVVSTLVATGALGLLRWFVAWLLRGLGRCKGWAGKAGYLALHQLGRRAGANALTCLCLAVSVMAVGLSTLLGPTVKSSLQSQLSNQLGGEIIVVAPAADQQAVWDALSSAVEPAQVASAAAAQVQLHRIADRPAHTALAAAIARGKTYLAEPRLEVLGLDFSQRRPPYAVVQGRDLTPHDTGQPTLLMLDSLATDLGIGVGDTLTVLAGGAELEFTVVGLLQSELIKTGSLYTSSATLAEVEHSRLIFYVHAPAGQAAATLQTLNRVLPRSALALSIDEQLLPVTQMLDFQTAVVGVVAALSLLAALLLVVGEITVNLALQRAELATMKVIGIPPGQLLADVAVRYGLLGLVGGLAGCAMAGSITVLVAVGLLRAPVVLAAWFFAIPLAAAGLAALVAALAAGRGLSGGCRRPDRRILPGRQ